MIVALFEDEDYENFLPLTYETSLNAEAACF